MRARVAGTPGEPLRTAQDPARKACLLPVQRRRPNRATMSAADLVALQREAGNQAVTALLRPVQRVGGWSGADTEKGKGLAPTDPQTGWNVGEHQVGSIRRIPIDGLVHGLQTRRP